LLAAAVAAYKSGELLYLSEEDEALSAENNLQYRVQDPWLPQVEAWLADKGNLLMRGTDDMADWITTAKILTDCIGIESKALKQYDRTRVEKILGFLGWQKGPVQTRLSNSANPQRGVWHIAVTVPDAAPAQPPAPKAQAEAPTQQLDLGEWPIEQPTPTPASQWIATHRTDDGTEFSFVKYLGREQLFAVGRTADGRLLSKIDAKSITPIGGAA
jgi:hypothetical protein